MRATLCLGCLQIVSFKLPESFNSTIETDVRVNINMCIYVNVIFAKLIILKCIRADDSISRQIASGATMLP